MSDSDRKDDAALTRLRHGSSAEQAELADMAGRDPSLRDRFEAWDRQDAALRALYDPVAHEPVPARHDAVLTQAERARGGGLPRWTRIAALVALMVGIGAAGGGLGYRFGRMAAPGAELSASAFRAHATYSVETAHPVEVAASEDPHLRDWLSNRLGRRIVPPNLDKQGFQLMGGRVLPADEGTAALMMYRDAGGRRLTLYVVSAPGREESKFEFSQRDQVRSFWWFDDDLGCAVVADLPRETLHDMAIDAYEQITGA